MVGGIHIDAVSCKLKALGVGKKGYRVPDLTVFHQILVEPANVAELSEMGIRLEGDIGTGNVIIFDCKPNTVSLSVGFNGFKNNRLLIESPKSLTGSMNFLGDNNLAVLGSGWHSMKVDFVGNQNSLYVGKNTSIGGSYMWIQGNEKSIVIGEDCMFAWGIGLRTGDAHGIIDAVSEVVTNAQKNIWIGAHVWLAQEVLVFKGVSVGHGTVVGARSVVSRDVPSMCLASGSPATVIRSNVTWSRSPNPADHELSFFSKAKYVDF